MIDDFFNTAACLKKIPRQGWINKTGIKNPESVADHTFSTTIMAMVLGDVMKLNVEKIVKMSLLHDLSESVTGDITPDSISKSDKINLESKTMNSILGKLPKTLQDDYLAIWDEYQENKSESAKLVHDLDKLEMALQAKIYSKEYASKNFDEFIESAESSIKSPEIKKILRKILECQYE